MEKDLNLNLKDTELRLGLPGSDAARGSKRASSDETPKIASSTAAAAAAVVPNNSTTSSPTTKAQAVGWPPIRSYRKNSFHQQEESGMYVKVSMDGAPYLRKIDIKGFKGYPDLLKALSDMFKFTFGDYSETEGYSGSDHVPTYEDKDGDWMLVGDVPWEMFMGSCKRLRIMKGSEAKGLGCNL